MGTLSEGDGSITEAVQFQLTGIDQPFATVSATGTLTLKGTSHDDQMNLDEEGSAVTVERNNDRLTFDMNMVKRIVIDGDGGNDSISASAVQPLSIFGGAGDDAITVASACLVHGGEGNDNVFGPTFSDTPGGVTLFGDGGNDYLAGGDRDDMLRGGSGNDTLDGGTGADDMGGGGGIDTADYSLRRVNLSISLDDKPNDGADGEHDNVRSDIENVRGGTGDDLIVGSPFNNHFEGAAGNDTLIGNSGDDTLIGGKGNDSITGGAGHDVLSGGPGDDQLFARDLQKDTVDGGASMDFAQFDDRPTLKDVLTAIESSSS